MFVSGKVGPHSHVKGYYLPLGVAVRGWRAEVVAVHAILGPQLGPHGARSLAASPSRAWRGRGGASSHKEGHGRNRDGGSKHGAKSEKIVFHKCFSFRLEADDCLDHQGVSAVT